VAPILARVNRSMSSSISIRTLTDGGQPAPEIARFVAGFLGEARRSLDLAQYDFNLGPETREVVGGALKEAAARGVAVRILYNVDHARPIPVPPPPEPDVALIESLGVPSRAVAGVPDLMHHKFVVRDGEAVLSGSTNWTDDSWSRQENVLVTVASEELAHAFALNFEELWKGGDVEHSGFVEPRPVEVDGRRVRAWFTPGFADALTHRLAKKIGHARRVRICSPVITAAPVLATLAQVVADGKIDVAGAVDQTQIEEVRDQWGPTGVASWKLPLLRRVIESGRFAGKRSTPWGPGTVHDYMHAKITITDDVVFLGSFNLSHSGEQNAENVLEIHDPALAERLAGFVDGVRARYPVATLDGRPARGGPPAPVEPAR